MKLFTTLLIAFGLAVPPLAVGQVKPTTKAISPDLFGIFFEDINYSANGGLYGEPVQNHSFEYSPSDHGGWHSLTSLDYLPESYAIGRLSVETAAPLHPNNPHYVQLFLENPMQKGLGLRNLGFDGIVLKAGEKYAFSLWARVKAGTAMPLLVQLRDKHDKLPAETTFSAQGVGWQPCRATPTSTAADPEVSLLVLATSQGGS